MPHLSFFKSIPLSLAAGLALTCISTAVAQEYDVVVYGGTPAGIMSAIAAAREGQSVLLLEQTRHIGGMSTSGLNRDESEHMDRRTFGGLCEQFIQTAFRQSGTEHSPGKPYTWQSHVAEKVFNDMLNAYDVPVRYTQLIDRVDKDGDQIQTLYVQGGTAYSANVFIDATYEGDLMAAAGVSYAVGREARDTYGESLAGVRYMDAPVHVPPYDDVT